MEDKYFANQQAEAEQGNEFAMFNLANSYLLGKNGLSVDFVKAEYWAKKAVETDPKDDEAWWVLGNSLINQNRPSEAENAFRNAVKNKSKELYYESLGFALYLQDKNECIEIWEKNSPNGTLAKKYLIKFKERHNIIEENTANTTDERLKKLIEEAETGDVDAILTLGYGYYRGEDGLDRDDEKAFFWATTAKEKIPENKYTWDLLGRCYAFGVGVEENEKKSIECLFKSVELGNNEDCGFLGEQLFFAGDSRCIEYLEKAVDDGDTQYLEELGGAYINNQFGTNNPQKGAELLKRGVELGDAYCANRYADSFWDEESCEIIGDREEALYYYSKAYDLGYKDSWRVLYFSGAARFYGTGKVEKNDYIARSAWEKLIPLWENNEYIKNYVVMANAILGDMCFEGAGGVVDRAMGEKCLRAAIGSEPFYKEHQKYVEKARADLEMYQRVETPKPVINNTYDGNSVYAQPKQHHRIRGALIGLAIGGVIALVLSAMGVPGLLCGVIVDIAVIIGIIKG